MPHTIASSTSVPPDVASSSREYATRFKGDIGQYFLEKQLECLKIVLEPFLKEKPTRSLSVLDIGGGHCQLIDFYLSKGFHVTVQGSDERSFIRIRDLGYDTNPKVSLKVCPLNKLVFEDNSFDLVCAFRLMAHIEDWRSFVREMNRVSKKGIVFDYARLDSSNILSPLLYKIKKKLEGNTRPFYCHWSKDIKFFLKELGLKDLTIQDQFFLPMGIYRTVGKKSIAKFAESLLNIWPLKKYKTPSVIFARKNPT